MTSSGRRKVTSRRASKRKSYHTTTRIFKSNRGRSKKKSKRKGVKMKKEERLNR